MDELNSTYYDEDNDEDDEGIVKITLPRPHEGQKKVLQSKPNGECLCVAEGGESLLSALSFPCRK